MLIAWAHVVFFGVVVPIAAFYTRAVYLKRTAPPNRTRFYLAALIQLVILGAISIVVAHLTGIDLFPDQIPSAEHAAIGFVILLLLIALLRPQWRRAVAENDRVVYLFMPATRDERTLWCAVALLAGFTEEITWRGVQTALLLRMTHNTALAVAIAAALFAITHVIQGWKSVAYIAGLALIFHGLVMMTGSLYVAMAVHFLYDYIAGLSYAQFARELGYTWKTTT